MDFVHELVRRGLDLAANDGHRLGKLAEGLSTIPASDQDAIIVRLQAVAAEDLSGSDRLTLWESLRNLIARHERFSTAVWAMTDATLEHLRALLEVLEPEDDPHRFDYLFDWHPDLPGVDPTDFTAYQAKQHQLQSHAISAILAQPHWIETLGEVAARVPVPMQLGEVLAEHDEAALADVTPWMVAEPVPLRDAATGWVRARLRLSGAPWLADTLGALRDNMPAREFVLRQVDPQGEYWRVIEMSKSDLDFYWSNAYVDRVPYEGIDEAVTELVKRGRTLAAIAVLSHGLLTDATDADRSHSIDPDMVVRVLNAAIVEDPHTRDASSMTGYYIGQLLDYLSSAGTGPGDSRSARVCLFPTS